MTDTLRELLRSDDIFVSYRLRHGAFVGARYPYLYVETPKAACTTTKHHLWRLEGLGEAPYMHRLHERPADDCRLSLTSLSEEAALAALAGRGRLRFIVWRDPVARLKSAYWDKIQLGRDPSPDWPRWRGAIRIAMGLADDTPIDFDTFARFACAWPDYGRDAHFMSQRRLTLADALDYDVIVRTDDYAAGMAEVFRALGVPRAAWPDLALRDNRSGSALVRASPAVEALIRETYAGDYAMLDARAASRAVAAA